VTARAQVIVYCDGFTDDDDRCSETIRKVNETSLHSARRFAADFGWEWIGDRDYCAHHKSQAFDD
jgi:hypothetical protein